MKLKYKKINSGIRVKNSTSNKLIGFKVINDELKVGKVITLEKDDHKKTFTIDGIVENNGNLRVIGSNISIIL